MSATLRSVAAACVLTLVVSPSAAAQQTQPAAATAVAPVERPPVKPLAAADGAKFVGDYDISLPDGRILAVKLYVEEEQLMAEPEGEGKAPLRYLGNDTFGLDFDPTLRLAFQVRDGKVTDGKLSQNGATMHVFRRP
jgi:hypothetical protein